MDYLELALGWVAFVKDIPWLASAVLGIIMALKTISVVRKKYAQMTGNIATREQDQFNDLMMRLTAGSHGWKIPKDTNNCVYTNWTPTQKDDMPETRPVDVRITWGSWGLFGTRFMVKPRTINIAMNGLNTTMQLTPRHQKVLLKRAAAIREELAKEAAVNTVSHLLTGKLC